MTATLTKLNTPEALRAYLARKERARAEEFDILPEGALAARWPDEKLMNAIIDMMSLTNQCRITRHLLGGTLQKVTVRVRYRPCVRMADAWKSNSTAALTQKELDGLRVAQGIARDIALRRRDPLERLYLLYGYVSGSIRYRTTDPHNEAAFLRLTAADEVLKTHEGNCQGHSEVMYLLGSMLGYSMGLQSGVSDGEDHCWNTVRLGRHVYTMDATAKITGEERRPTLKNSIHFLMGAREAGENGLFCRPEQVSVELSPSLSQQHDIYHLLGTDFRSEADAARCAWQRRIAGERSIQLRISSGIVTQQSFMLAMKAAASDPAIQQQLFRSGGRSVSYRVQSVSRPRALYATVEWDD